MACPCDDPSCQRRDPDVHVAGTTNIDDVGKTGRVRRPRVVALRQNLSAIRRDPWCTAWVGPDCRGESESERTGRALRPLLAVPMRGLRAVGHPYIVERPDSYTHLRAHE